MQFTTPQRTSVNLFGGLIKQMSKSERGHKDKQEKDRFNQIALTFDSMAP